MYPNQQQPVSMIESSHPVDLQAQQPRKNKTPLIVIGICIVLLIVLAVVLVFILQNGKQDAASTGYSPNYKQNYTCAVDQYEYKSGVFEIDYELSADGKYKIGLSDAEYTTGTFKEKDQTRATSEDGGREINYHLIFTHDKDYIDGEESTEVTGDESEYIININEKSDAVVITDKSAESTYYCKVK